MSTSVAEQLAELDEADLLAILSTLPEAELEALYRDWRYWARPEQLTPEGLWTIWAYVAGRGAGKTRSGAEFILDRAERFADSGHLHRAALVGRTAADCRDTMVEGESGLAACCEMRGHTYKYEPSKRRFRLPDLATSATTFSAEEPESLRGPQHHTGWADEPAAWSHKVDPQGNTAWTNLMFGLRLDPPASTGLIPQVCATTTPKPIPLVVEWFRMAGLIEDEHGTLGPPDPSIHVTRGSLYDNLANLSPAFVAFIVGQYGGTRLAAQEIMGDLLQSVEGALWQPEDIEPSRLGVAGKGPAPEPSALGQIVVAVDPPGSVTGAEAGIVVVGADAVPQAPTGRPVDDVALARVERLFQRHAYVLADVSCRGRTEKWAAAAVAAYRGFGANGIVGEVNNGGDMVRAAIHAIDPTIPFHEVRATRGKRIRAEPVALLSQRGRVHMVGYHGLLESQLLTWTPADPDSPDRLDAFVWGVTHLMPGLSMPQARSKSPAAGRVQTGAAAATRQRGVTPASRQAPRVPNARDRRG